MFSPINFPADRLPEWLRAIHRVLPFESMARVVRDTLTTPPEGIALLPIAVLRPGARRAWPSHCG